MNEQSISDLELLELAAKAMGYLNWTPSTAGLHIEQGSCRGAITSYWTPLTDDGDAFRLAVRLNLNVEIHRWITVVYQELPCEIEVGERNDMNNSNPYAATRRAIVRAAAEIGRRMK